MHLEDLADALFLVLGRVDDLLARVQLARIHANVGQAAEERVNRDLERQSRKRFCRLRLAREVLLGVANVGSVNVGNVERRRQVVDDRVEHRLNTAVLERGTTENGVRGARDRHLANRCLDFRNRGFFASEELLKKFIAGFRHGFDEIRTVFLGLGLKVSGDRFNFVRSTERNVTLRVTLPHEGAHLDEVYDADECRLETDRELDDEGLCAEALDDGVNREIEVSTEFVHLVDKTNAGDVVFVGLTPHGLGLRFDTFFTVEDGNGTVENTERTLYLDREVDVPRGVNNVDLVLVPETRRRSRRDCDSTLLLLGHPVHRGRSVVNFTDLVRDSGVVEDTFSRRRLTGIDVSHDADVADLVEVGEHVLCHVMFSVCVSV